MIKERSFYCLIFIFIFININIFAVDPATKSYKAGDKFLKEGDYKKSLESYLDALGKSSHPDMVSAIYNDIALCYNYLAEGNEETILTAIKYFKLCENASYNFLSLTNLALLYYELGDYKTSREYLKKSKDAQNTTWFNMQPDKNILQNATKGFADLTELVSQYNEIKKLYEWQYYEDVVKLSKPLIYKSYKIHFGIDSISNRVDRVYYGSIADKSGVLKGDIILSIGGQIIPEKAAFYTVYRALSKYSDKYGESFDIKIMRSNRPMIIRCKLSYPEVEDLKEILKKSKELIAEGKSKLLMNPDDQSPKFILLSPYSSTRALKKISYEDIYINSSGITRGLKNIDANNNISSEIEFEILAGDNTEIDTATINGKNFKILPTEPIDEKTLYAKSLNRYGLNIPIDLKSINTRALKNNADNNEKISFEPLEFKIELSDKSGNKTAKNYRLFFLDKKNIEQEKGIEDVIEEKITLENQIKMKKNQIALVIGIDEYKYLPKEKQLRGAKRDAKNISESLKKAGYNVIGELYNSQATQARILTELGDGLNKLLKTNDSLIVYFAGHGATEEKSKFGIVEGYLVPNDGKIEGEDYINCIPMSNIKDFIKRYKNKQILFIFDSCYSGLMLDEKSNDDLNKKIIGNEIRYIMTAGSKNEEAMESDGQGFFTKYIIKGLNGDADRNNDEIITVTEISNYVKPRVQRDAKNNNHSQNPQSGYLKGDGIFYFEE